MKTVLIDANGKVFDPKDRVVSVSKLKEEEIRWVDFGGKGPWKITFDKDVNGSPFGANQYTVNKGASETTGVGPIAGLVGRTYRYNVRNASTNAITDDPDVDVE
jgi:hypothetical protein